MARMTKKTKVIQNVEAFCEQTTIHGFLYTVGSGNHLIVKVAWFMIVAVFMTLACFLIKMSFNDWSENPTVTTTDSAAYPIENEPFPSVTICQEDPGIR